MKNTKYLLFLFFGFCMLHVNLNAQFKKEMNLVKKYVDSLDSIIGINKNELMKGTDSILIIHHKGSVYQIYKYGEKYKVVQVLLLEKEIKSKREKRFFKTLMRTDTFYLEDGKKDNIINARAFNELFDLNKASGDKSALNFRSSPTNTPNILDLYIVSISFGKYQFRDLITFLLDDVNCNDKPLDVYLEQLFLRFNHWERIEKMVKDNGYGVYKYSKDDMGIVFEYKSNKKYRIEGYPKEVNRPPKF